LPPIPPDTESGAGVFAFDPILTPDRALDVKTILPEPLAARVKLLFAVVVISGLWPPARVRTPAGEIELLVLKKLIFPWVPLVVETRVSVPPEFVPPLIVALLPRVKLAVAFNVRLALLVSVVRFGAEMVVPLSVRLPAEVIALFPLKKLTLPVVPRVSD